VVIVVIIIIIIINIIIIIVALQLDFVHGLIKQYFRNSILSLSSGEIGEGGGGAQNLTHFRSSREGRSQINGGPSEGLLLKVRFV
jgi:hypothetical protein